MRRLIIKSFTMELIQKFKLTRLETLVVWLKKVLSWLAVIALVVLTAYVFYFYLEARADWRVERAELETQVQMLEGHLMDLQAQEAGLIQEGQKLQDSALEKAKLKVQTPR